MTLQEMTVTYVQVFCCGTWEKPRIISVTKAAIRCPLILFFKSLMIILLLLKMTMMMMVIIVIIITNVIFYSFVCMFWVFISFVVLCAFLCYCSFVIERRLRKIAKSTISFVTSVCPSAWNSSAPTGPIFMKFDIWVFFSKSCRV